MLYYGGKNRTAKKIAKVIVSHCSKEQRELVYEPFCGSGAVSLALANYFDLVLASDKNKSLILMLQALQDGWIPPFITKERWYELKYAPESALRGFAMSQFSFRGVWAQSYGMSKMLDPHFGGHTKDVTSPEYIASFLQDFGSKYRRTPNVVFEHCAYEDQSFLPNYPIYCDPPYIGDTSVYHSGFDVVHFYAWAKKISRTNPIFLSERICHIKHEVVMEVELVHRVGAWSKRRKKVREHEYLYLIDNRD